MRYEPSRPPPAPDWLKVRLQFATGKDTSAGNVRSLLKSRRMVTVCQEASCPNLSHCWSQGTATFMILGDRCTRRCGFCDVATGRPLPLDKEEPLRLARTVQELKLRHCVITSVDRDDLPDCGADHFAKTIEAVRQLNPGVRIEVLIPDFKGRIENLERIALADPDVLNHNLETVEELFPGICPQSSYKTSLEVLAFFAKQGFLTKSGLILGLGEELIQVHRSLQDLRSAGVAMLTIGQYLQPDADHAPLKEYIHPSVFKELKERGLKMGFQHVESGPLVRSSYHAAEPFEKTAH